jgi:tetratricopeptide (TPR) repeat protein
VRHICWFEVFGQGQLAMSNPKSPTAVPTAAAPKAPAAAVEKAASPQNPSPPTPAELPPRGMLFPLLLTVGAVFPLAIGIGVVRIKASTSPAQAEWVTAQKPNEDQKSRVSAPTTDRRIGDESFLNRRYEVALQYYQSLGNSNLDRLPAELLYRCALCEEALGMWNEAVGHLRTVAETTDQPRLKAAAIFGQGRLWTRLNEPVTAESLFRSLILRDDLLSATTDEMRNDAAFLIPLLKARSSTAQVRAANQCSPRQINEFLNWPLETALAWVDGRPESESEAADAFEPANSLFVRAVRGSSTDNFAANADLQFVDICCHQQPLGKIIEQLAEELAWDIDLSNQGDPRSFERVVSISAKGIPVDYLLTLLCPESQSTWTIENNSLIIGHSDPSGKTQRRMVTQTLESRIRANPNHRLIEHARFTLAELAQAEADVFGAASQFAALAGPKSTAIAVRAAYCSASNYFRLGELELACTQLQRLVDGAPESEIHPEATLMLGRLLLDRGEVQDAVFQLRRATEPNNPSPIQARASVLLGMSYLVQKKYQEAAEAVFSRKLVLEDPAVRTAAAFVTAYARWKSLSGESQEREATYLYRSLLAMKADSDWLGQTGQLLIGRVYVELGFDDQMADLYSHMLTVGVTRNIAGEMMYSLADYDLEMGRREAAKETWWMLSSGASRRLSNRSRFRLAEVALIEGRPKDCLEFCELTRTDDTIARTDIQKLMGRAYEALGEDALAARCYAGQMINP